MESVPNGMSPLMPSDTPFTATVGDSPSVKEADTVSTAVPTGGVEARVKATVHVPFWVWATTHMGLENCKETSGGEGVIR